jgi:ABC-type long-subunit fatty acid transport system fused permease/ATPase subunit
MHGAEMTRNLRVSKASKHAVVGVTLCGWDFRNKSVNGAVRRMIKMMDELGVEVAEMHQTVNLLLRRGH